MISALVEEIKTKISELKKSTDISDLFIPYVDLLTEEDILELVCYINNPLNFGFLMRTRLFTWMSNLLPLSKSVQDMISNYYPGLSGNFSINPRINKNYIEDSLSKYQSIKKVGDGFYIPFICPIFGYNRYYIFTDIEGFRNSSVRVGYSGIINRSDIVYLRDLNLILKDIEISLLKRVGKYRRM